VSAPALAAALIIALACAPCIAADVRKCAGADGKVTYIDGPCPAGAKPERIRPPDAPSPALAKYGPWVRFYDVEGIEFEALLAELNKFGPNGFHGEASWRVSYTFRTAPRDGRCFIGGVETKMQGNILMPRWSKRQGASADLVARWQRYEAALLAHEEGHLDNGREFARVLESELLQLPAAGDCPRLSAAARARYDELLQTYRKRDADYDERTQHGVTQGAKFY
jgi:predicted secreted Zn-dependent protease